ncbi:MAG: hypothetical protein KGO96_06985 [Elusimicrobia bacterium]|nr:hypothetical protein [Elusimicrobiota bacterium]
MKFATDGQPIGFKKTYTGPLDALTNEMGRSFGISITKSKETDNKFSTRLWTKTYSSAIKGATLEESIRKALIIFRRGRRY